MRQQKSQNRPTFHFSASADLALLKGFSIIQKVVVVVM